jgi:hypothetical protein
MKGALEYIRFSIVLIGLLLATSLYGQNSWPQPAVNQLGCNWGYKIGDKWLVEPIYDMANGFSYADSVAIVRLGEKYGMIDLNGKMLIDLEADEIHLLGKTDYSFNDVINGYYVVKKGDTIGLYNVSAKKMMFKLTTDEIKIWHKQDSLLKLEYQLKQTHPSSGKVYVSNLVGIANLNQVLISPCSEYIAPTGNRAYVFSRDEQYYLASDKGKQLSQKGYDYILPYWQNGFYVVEKNGYQGLIDDRGTEVLLPEWYLYNFGSDYKRPSNHVSSLNYNRYLKVATPDKKLHNIYNLDSREFLFDAFADSFNTVGAGLNAYFFKNKHGKYSQLILAKINEGLTLSKSFSPETSIWLEREVLVLVDKKKTTCYDHNLKMLFEIKKERFLGIEQLDDFYLVETSASWLLYHKESGELLSSWTSKPQINHELDDTLVGPLFIHSKKGRIGISNKNGKSILKAEFDSVIFGRQLVEKETDDFQYKWSYGWTYFAHNETLRRSYKYYPLLVKDGRVYNLFEYLEGNKNPIRASNVGANAQVFYQNPKGPWIIFNNKGEIIANTPPPAIIDYYNQKTEFIGADSSFLQFSNAVFSVKHNKVVAKGKFRKVFIDDYGYINCDGYLLQVSGDMVCPNYQTIASAGNNHFFGYDSLGSMYFLDLECQRIVDEPIFGLAEWQPTTRTCFVLLEKIDGEYYYGKKHFWYHVRIDDYGKIEKLSDEAFVVPYLLDYSGYQQISTEIGKGLLDTDGNRILEPIYHTIHYVRDKCFVINKGENTAFADLNGNIKTAFDSIEIMGAFDQFAVVKRNDSLLLIDYNDFKFNYLKSALSVDEKVELINSGLENSKLDSNFYQLSNRLQAQLIDQLLDLFFEGPRIGTRDGHFYYAKNMGLHVDNSLLKSYQTIGELSYMFNKKRNEAYLIKAYTVNSVSIEYRNTYQEVGRANAIFHSIEPPRNYVLSNGRLEYVQLDEILDMSPTNYSRLNELVLTQILLNEDLYVQCSKEGDYLDLVKDNFFITRAGICFQVHNYNNNETTVILVSKANLKGFLKVKLW